MNYCGYSGEQVFFTLDDGMSGAPESSTSITTSSNSSLDEKGFFYRQPAEKHVFFGSILVVFCRLFPQTLHVMRSDADMPDMTHWWLFCMRVECIKTPYGGANEASILVSAERDEKPDLTELKE